MAGADFNQNPSNRDRDIAKTITDNNVHKIINKTRRIDLLRIFIAAMGIMKPLSYPLRALFHATMTNYPKDKVMNDTYHEGVDHGYKRQPKKFYTDRKQKVSYENGVYEGEEKSYK